MTVSERMASHLLALDPADNVAVALTPLFAGTELLVDGAPLTVHEDVPAGHKIALADLEPGQLVIKYGHPIGTVTRRVTRGDWLHTHSMRTTLEGVVTYRYEPIEVAQPATSGGGTFAGYRRASGAVGTRNEVWVVNTVGCVNRSAERITRLCREQFHEGTDGVHTFAHPYGCSQAGDDLESTRRILAALLGHPNAGGVLLMGLGCEDNQIDGMLEAAGDVDRSRIRHFDSQDVRDDVEHGVALVGELVERMRHDRRTEHGTGDLVAGLKCGGSDGLSGITANSLVGRIADRITAEGGAAILTEVPEMFGAEQALMNRAVDERVFRDIEGLVNGFKQYYSAHGRPIYENPSPGNLEGGLTTLEEKALGATRKGGRAAVTGVLRYGERVHDSGLTLLEAPGNDAVSTTALVAAGATVILFTTGRGTPLGAPVPTVKIASNTALAARKPGWIDFDAGRLASGPATMDELAADLYSLVLEVASGRRQTANERNDYRDIAIWKTGVTL